jgi:hypothetical protein
MAGFGPTWTLDPVVKPLEPATPSALTTVKKALKKVVECRIEVVFAAVVFGIAQGLSVRESKVHVRPKPPVTPYGLVY